MAIRFARETDIPAILAIYGPYVENTAYSFEYTVPTLEEFTARFRTYTAQFPWLVWEEQGQVLGYAYGSAPFTRAAYGWCAEISVYLCPQAQGRGIGKSLCRVLEEIIFMQGYRVIYSLITTDNTGSVAFHKKLGYQAVAVLPDCGIKFGRQLGIVYMEKRSKTVVLPKAPPLSCNEVVKSDSIFQEILVKLSLS